MNQEFTCKLKGLPELLNLLEQLPTVSMQKTAVRNALKKSAAPILNVAKLNVPRGDAGNLEKSLKISTSLKASQKKGQTYDRTRVTVYVGSSAPHAHLIEFGTKDRTQKKTGRFTGRISPNPFLRNAWDSTKEIALKILARELRAQIYAAARRLRKRAEKGKLTTKQIEGLNR
ncbi:MAG TPA: HK97 gp10 family phage protein [Smithellaceae bacterium]|jgi:HK97 gp10 family phage protein|nr:HK97 gp10 family phage protein [Smithella sp.]HPD57638.1 HK97 gp10 family phage protein [Smithellaceae bacterium]HRS90183.1 HK97 gp10 family phage protein [Smithellaceae bacterium]